MLLSALTAMILCAAPARALPDDFKFDLEGYYRTRAMIFADGLLGNKKVRFYGDQSGDARMFVQRLRLQPEINFEDRAKFIMQADLLDDVVWGDNQSLSSTALFGETPSSTGVDGTTQAPFKLNRAWMEFKLPVGLVKVGRQPSNWGMGLLSNAGDGFDDSFGENHYGSTYDRAIFATKPIAIAQTIAGKDPTDIPLYLALGVDRVVEDPLNQYYGYNCSTSGTDGSPIVQGDATYDARCDPDGDGYHTVAHGYEADRTDSSRGSSWWADQTDDVWEMVYALIYKGEGVELAGSKADLSAGAYIVNRKQQETASNIWISDLYLKFLWRGLYFEGEGVNIRGQTYAIALPGALNADQSGVLDASTGLDKALYKKANIWGYVARAGYKKELFSLVMEHGYASGDDNPGDADFTGRPLHPDYNVGLLIYEELLAYVTAATWTDSASGLWSNGGVYNSRYIYPQATWSPMDNWHITGAWLMAWPDKPDGSRILCAADDKV